MKLFFSFFLVLLIISFSGYSQDTHFSQLNETPLFLNPANTGAFNGDFRANLNYRDQWRSISEPYTSYHMSIDAPIIKSKTSQLGIGAFLISDKAGINSFTQNMFMFSISGGVKLGRSSSVSAGINAGLFSQRIDNSLLIWDDQYNGMFYDPSSSSAEVTQNFSTSQASVGAGLLFKFMSGSNNPYFNDGIKGSMGFAVNHLNTPTQLSVVSLDNKNMLLKTHGVFSFGIQGTNVALIPSFLYMRQGTQQELCIGLVGRFLLREQSRYTGFIKSSAFTIGGSYRVGDALVLQTMFEFSNFAFGICYDLNSSGLSQVSNSYGALELSLRFVTPSPSKAKLSNNPFY